MNTRRIPILLLASVAVASMTTGAHALAQNRDEPERRQIVRVSGDAIATAQPDEVWLDIGVVTEAPTAQQAASDNARRVEKVLAALRSELGAGSSIKTSNYSINPSYGQPRAGNAPVITSYMVSNTVEVRTGELAKVGQIIDAAIKAEANNVNRVQFTLKDQAQPMAAALKEATTKARAKADAVASALGMHVVRIIAVEEGGGGGPEPLMFQSRMKMAGDAETPIEAGSIDVHATVTLTAEMTP